MLTVTGSLTNGIYNNKSYTYASSLPNLCGRNATSGGFFTRTSIDSQLEAGISRQTSQTGKTFQVKQH